MLLLRTLAASVLAVCATTATVVQAAPEPVTIYSSRIEQLIKPILDQYTKETGVEIRMLTDNGNALIERLAAEGASTPADLLVTVDVGNLWRAADRGVLKPSQSDVLTANIPASMRAPDGSWYGLSRRERTIFFDPKKIKPEQLSTYEDLADPKWKGLLCLRTGKQTYTQSLTAMLLAHYGVEKTETIIKGWVSNLATDVFTSDAKLLEAIAAGQCAVGIANTYYYGRLINQDPGFKDKVSLFWANQGKDQGGVHVNLSGGGITTHAKNPEGAMKFLEWLSSEHAQSGYTHGTFESPVNEKVQADPIVEAWGEFIPNTTNAADVGRLQPEAILLLDRVGYR